MKKTGFVFINGAGLSPSIWDEVMEKIDMPTLAIAYPERGNKKKSVALTFDDYIDSATRQIATFPAKKIILVGHSIGGVVMMRLAELLKGRVAGMIAVGATIPEPGGSFLSCLPQPQRTVMGLMLRLAGTSVPESSIRKSLCSGLSDDQAQRIVDSFTPESRAFYTTPVQFSRPKVPAMYIVLTDDHEFTTPFQHSMAARMNAKTVEIHGGHLSMISHADEVAAHITAFARDL